MALLAGCGINAPQPARTSAPETPVVPISSLSITLVIPAVQITRLLNNMTEYQLADIKGQTFKCGPVSCRLDLHATRIGPLALSMEDNGLRAQIPFSTRAAVTTSGFLSFLHGQAEGAGILDAHTKLTILPNFQLHGETTGSVLLDSGQLRVGPLVTNIAQVWNQNEDRLSRPLWHSVDKNVAKLPLRQRVAALWTDAFRPIHAGKSPNSWLVVRPERLVVAQPQMRNSELTVSLGLEGRAQVAIQDTAPTNTPTKLPAAVPGSPSDTFSVAVPVLLPYDRAAQLALASLQKRPVKAAGMGVTFSRLTFLPSGRDLVVSSRLCLDPSWDPFSWFSSCGNVYMRGVPIFDPQLKEIRVEHLHYDIGSASPILRILGDVAGDQLTQLLQSRLVFHEAGPIEHLQSQIQELLETPHGRDVSVSASVNSFSTPAFTWTDKGFWALFRANGKIKADLNL